MVTNYTPNGLNQYTAVSGHTAPLYDTKFNLSGYDGWTYIYDADKRLISAGSATGGGHSAQFVYDGLGRCVKRTIDGVSTVYTYDEWKTVAEWSDAGAFVAWNLYGPGADEILVRYQPNTGGYLHYHLDAMGNVQFLLSGELNLGLEKYPYDAFGQPRITGWDGDVRTISRYGNRFMFTGREYLYTLGIYDYRHRLYHPGLGRFIQTDPVGFAGDPMNLYRYCGGNPVLHSDPTGLVDQDGNNKSSLTSFGGGDWVNGSDGLSARDRREHQQAGILYTMAVESRVEGPKLLPLPRDLLARMYATNEKNAEQASDRANWTPIPGTNKSVQEESSTTIYRRNGGLVQIGPKVGYHNNGPRSYLFGRALKGGGTRVAGTHIHVTGNGRHFGVDIDRARENHYISGVGHVSTPHILNIYIPPSSGRGPGAFYHTNDGVRLLPGER